MEIKQNIKLSDYSTFKIGGLAEFFVVVENEADLILAINWANKNKKKIFILGVALIFFFLTSIFPV